MVEFTAIHNVDYGRPVGVGGRGYATDQRIRIAADECGSKLFAPDTAEDKSN